MALPCSHAFPLLFLLSSFSFISSAIGGVTGVNYGRVADNLKPPDQVVQLLKDNHIDAVNIYDADATVLRSFSGTGIKLSVALPNELLSQAAANPDFASDWVRNNVAAYVPSTQIESIAVGNEVFHCCADLNRFLVPAMQNIADALARQGLANAVKVSTPIAFDAITNSFPPSDGVFRQELQPVMRQILDLLDRTGSFLMINIYTYQAYIGDPSNIPLDYALGRAKNPVVDSNTGRSYYSLLDAQVDAVYSAMDRLGPGRNAVATTMQAGPPRRRRVALKETGWPHGPPRPRRTAGRLGRRLQQGGSNLNASLAEGSGAATVENAQAYNANLIQRALARATGTPLHPDADMDVYIFSLFDENQKGGDPTERSYGLFYPDGSKVYQFSFQATGYTPTPVGPPAGNTWCEANGAVGRERLQAALDWACGPGKADCGPIQPGAACFEPDTVEAHATFAFNSYYQKQGRNPGACDFQGTGRIVTQTPSLLTRDCNGPTWCAANSQVGRDRLQAALDWACGEGKADCGPVRPGGPCFEPNTLEAHATYAFNSYYQQHNRGPGTCNFNGAASIVFQRPQIGNCKLPP